MIIVSINYSRPTASILSIPRDLFVYIPGWTMNRINTALSHGSSVGYPGGGIGLLRQTILYNFGVPIHYYARVDFEGFQEIIDAINGVDLNVSCRLEDWRLKSPELDPLEVDNWERFALEPGVHHMDGDLALWYARSRLSTNDFERGRRQQQLLRALLNQGVDLDLLPQVPTLWNAFHNTVDTDLDIGRVLRLAALAPGIRENGVQHLYLAGKIQPWSQPDSGAQVQLPIWEGDGMMRETFQRLFLPPALSRAVGAPIYVEVINATNNADLAILAADNLAWYGFIPIIGTPEPQENAVTQLSFYKPNFKDSYDWLLSWVIGKRRADIQLVADETYEYDYRVVLGNDYDPCRPQLFAPQAFLNQ
jgi:LCP family protein required for cell wall assembly